MTPSAPDPEDSTYELQFAVAEPSSQTSAAATQAVLTCLACHRPIDSIYYALKDQTLCPSCCALVNAPPKGSAFGRVAKAALMGTGAGLVGAIIWFAIRKIAHLEIGLVAVLVGFMVGKAVRKGSGGRGGRGYQVLAVIVTYCCIAANYMPDVAEALWKVSREKFATTAPSVQSANRSATAPVTGRNAAPTVDDDADVPRPKVGLGKAALAVVLLAVVVFVVSLAAPFLAGAQNLIGLLIVGFALWEAWKFNRYMALPITGPYQIGSGPRPPANQLPMGGAI